MHEGAGPVTGDQPRQQVVYYNVDARRVTLEEMRFEAILPVAMLAWGLTRLGVSLPSSTDDLPVESLWPFESDYEALPTEARLAMQPQIDALVGLGFIEPIYHLFEDVLHQTTTVQATLRHSGGGAIGRVHWRWWQLRKKGRQKLLVEFITPLRDGRWLWSKSGVPDMLAPDSCLMNRHRRADAVALWRAHQQVQADQAGGAEPVRTQEQMAAQVEALHQAVRDFHIQRGVFVPLDEQEQAIQRGLAIELPDLPTPLTGEQASVLTELQRLACGRGQSRWTSGLWILVLSLLFFVGAGAATWSWDFVLLLVAVLFIHETGHYVAMRLLGYQNVQMFFIPLFGAAVKGTHHHAPGWKKAVVSLAGPLLGMAVGVIAGILGVVFKSDVLMEGALLSMILNAINLAPVLPLDGGQLMHTVLFSRHYALDVVFRALAALALLAAGGALEDRMLFALAIFLILSLPLTWKLGRVGRELRRAGVAQAQDTAQGIDLAAAAPIVQRVCDLFKTGASRKTQAQHALLIYQTINTRPPGVIVSILLLLAMVGTIVTGLAGTGVLTLARAGLLTPLWNGPQATPSYPLTPSAIVSAPGPSAAPTAADSHALFAVTLDDPIAAQAAYATLPTRLPPQASIMLLGQSLLVAVPVDDAPARSACEMELATLGQVLTHSPEQPLMMSIECLAPDEQAATAISQEIGVYTMMLAAHLMPPWYVAPQQEIQRWQACQQAREVFRQLQQALIVNFDDPEFAEVPKLDRETARDADRLKQALEQQQVAMRKIQKRKLEAFAQSRPADEHTPMVDRYIELFDANEFIDWSTPDAQLASYLGQLPMNGQQPEAQADRWSLREGAAFVMPGQRQVHLAMLTFASPLDGLPQVARWLEQRGCSDFKYAMIPNVTFDATIDD